MGSEIIYSERILSDNAANPGGREGGGNEHVGNDVYDSILSLDVGLHYGGHVVQKSVVVGCKMKSSSIYFLF